MSAASALFSTHFTEVRQALEALQGAASVGGVLDARESWSNRTALEAACLRGDLRVARLLLRSGADACAQVAGAETALHCAVQATRDCEEWQAVSLLEALLGSQWEEPDGQLASALRPASAQHALDAGCSLSMQGTGTRVEEATPLYLAAHLGSLVAARVLLLHGANPRQAARLTFGRGQPPMLDLPLDAALRCEGLGMQPVSDLLKKAALTPIAELPAAAAQPHAPLGAGAVAGAAPVAASLNPPAAAPAAVPPSPLAVAFSDPEVYAKLDELRELHWSDRFYMDVNSESMSKKEALLVLICSHPRCAAAYSLLARDLPHGETVLIDALSDKAVGTRELLFRALELDDADLMALRALIPIAERDASRMVDDMPHGCGPATPEALSREIYYIRSRRLDERRFSRAAGKARLVELEAAAARVQAEREAAARAAQALALAQAEREAAIAKAVDAAQERERQAAAAKLQKNVDKEEEAAAKTPFLPTLLADALHAGGLPESHVPAFVAALQSQEGADGKLASVVLASLLRDQQNTMRDAVALLQDVLQRPDKAGTLLCDRASQAQTKFRNIFPPEAVPAGEPGSEDQTLRLGDVPTACRPFIALAHLLSGSNGSWADDAAAHLTFYFSEGGVEPSPIALLALGLWSHYKKQPQAAAALLYAFAHWGAVAPLFVGGSTEVGPCAAHWLGPLQKSDVAASGAEFLLKPRSASSATNGEEPSQQRHADGPEEEWKEQKLQQARLPANQQLQCPALDKIMEEFDGLRAVKEACLALYIEVKQARVRAACTGTKLQEQLSDNPFHFVFLGNPGTGKTSIAQYVHQLLVQLGVRADAKQYVQLDNGQRLARDGPDKFMKEHVKNSIGGTLFIDEAYQLVGNGSSGTGQAVLDELLTVAENQRHEISIILSGYKKEMEDMINGGNVGLASRFPRRLLFEDFDQPMLLKLLYRFVKKQKLSIADPLAKRGAEALSFRIARGCGKPGFANARTMRTQWGLVVQRMSARAEEEAKRDPLRKRAPEEDTQLQLSDFLGQPPSPETDPALLKLNTLIGLNSAKAALHKIATQLQQNYREECEGGVPKPFSLNCIFAGNAGTGKTSVAEMFADFLCRCGLASGITIITPAKFMAGTAGETRTALRDILNAAALSGRVLFIDEAHTMFETDDQAGGGGVPPLKESSRAAFESIVSAIPGDGSSAFVLILAGYTDLLRDMLAHPRVDQGFLRRVPHWVDFDDFSNEELRFLVKQKAESKQFQLNLSFSTADVVVRSKLAKMRARRGWGNAGSVHNEVLDAAARQQVRLARRSEAPPSAAEKNELIASDFEVNAQRALEGPEFAVQRAMEGLTNAEALAKQLQRIADAAREQVQLEKESPAKDEKSKPPKDSYLFLGAPGTGKTTVARRLAELLCDLGVLPSDHTHEVQGTLLIGSYLGQTKDKVKAAFEAAKGGLLFIDEAYALFPNDVYRKEAVDTIVSLMTQPPYVGNMTLVLAGYKEELDALLNSPSVNPGIRRRFAQTLHFSSWDAKVSVTYIVEQLGLKRKHVLPEAQAALAELVATMIERCEKQWSSAGHCIVICDQVNGAADARYSEYKRSVAAQRVSKKLSLSAEDQARDAAAEAAFFYVGDAAPDGADAATPYTRLVTAQDVLDAALSVLPPVKAATTPATLTASADGVATATVTVTAQAPPKPVAVLVVSEPEAEEEAPEEQAAGEGADALLEAEIAKNKAVVVQPLELVLSAAMDVGQSLDEAEALLAAGEAGSFAASLLGKLGGAPSSAEARNALRMRCAQALAIIRAQLAERAAEEKRIADLKAAEEAAARERDEARQAAIAAQMALVRKEQQAQQRLQQMGVCSQGFRWNRVGSGYQCAGGSHFISCSALGL